MFEPTRQARYLPESRSASMRLTLPRSSTVQPTRSPILPRVKQPERAEPRARGRAVLSMLYRHVDFCCLPPRIRDTASNRFRFARPTG
jgi:hypothetical protein